MNHEHWFKLFGTADRQTRLSSYLPCMITLQTRVYKVPVAGVVAVGFVEVELEDSSVLPRLSVTGWRL